MKEAQQQIESQHEKAVKDELKCLDDLDAARIQDREVRSAALLVHRWQHDTKEQREAPCHPTCTAL